jgi:hypothetical protein
LRPQVFKFFPSELKNKVRRETICVALYLLIQPLGLYAVKLFQIRIQDNLDATKLGDTPFHVFGWHEILLSHGCAPEVVATCNHLGKPPLSLLVSDT